MYFAVQLLSLILCDPMDCSTLGFPVFHYLPKLCSNLCPLSGWYHPNISSSVSPFSYYPHSFLASGSFLMSWLFASGGQSIGALVSVSVLTMSIQGRFLLGLPGLISLLSEGLSRIFSNTTGQKHQFFNSQPSLWCNSSCHQYMTTGKTTALTIWTYVCKVISLPFNMLSKFVIAFLPRSKHLLISWLQSPSAVIFEPQKIKFVYCFHCFSIYLPRSNGTRGYDLSFLNVGF